MITNKKTVMQKDQDNDATNKMVQRLIFTVNCK